MTVAIVGVAALAAACVQSTTGIGFALVLTPVMFAVLPPAGAILTVTALGLELNLLVLLAERRRPQIAWRRLVPILVAAIPGMLCGVLVLRALPKPALQIAVGVALVGSVVVRMSVSRAPAVALAESAVPERASAALAIGFTTGALTTSTGVSGPPLALWISKQQLSPRDVRDALSAMFLALGAIAMITLIPLLHHTRLSASLLLSGVAFVAAGHALGRRAFARLESRRFEPLLLAVVFCAGWLSIAAGAGAA